MPLTPTSEIHQRTPEATYIPVVDLLLVPSLLGLGGTGTGNLWILQLALPHLVDGRIRGPRGVLPLLGCRLELRYLA